METAINGSTKVIHIRRNHWESLMPSTSQVVFVGDDDFIVFLGDNYLNDELSSLYDAYSSDEMDGMFTLRKLRVLHSSV